MRKEKKRRRRRCLGKKSKNGKRVGIFRKREKLSSYGEGEKRTAELPQGEEKTPGRSAS